jgi:octaprenyl-diphosphate synthase
LFEAAARLGAVLGRAGPELEDALARYGMHLGTAFQLIDDVLDYTGDPAAMGKNPGNDLAEGKATLPLIRALNTGSSDDIALIRSALEKHDQSDLAAVLSVLQRTGALDYARACAETESSLAAECLTTLPPTSYREVLLELSAFAVARSF